VGKLLLDIKTEVETGSSLGQAFRKYPMYFDQLFCNLVSAGEAAGILDTLLERLATYKEKILAIKGKIKSALFYPVAIIVVAIVVTAVIMIFVIPVFKDLFKNFGAELPTPTLIVMNISDFMLANWFPAIRAAGRGDMVLLLFVEALGHDAALHGPAGAANPRLRRCAAEGGDRALVPHAFHDVRRRRAAGRIARFGRGLAGNYVFYEATKRIQSEVSTGTSFTAMTNAEVFPSMVLQMCAIGEESGRARRDARQGRGLLRAGGRRGGRLALLADGADDHGRSWAASSAASWSPCTCRSSRWARPSSCFFSRFSRSSPLCWA
jgi:type IV pilus assembly protein PilC